MERCARGDDGRTLTFYLFLILSFIPLVSQRKSNKAKEKKARRLEERAAMDAICAKVDAANKVTFQQQPSQTALLPVVFGC